MGGRLFLYLRYHICLAGSVAVFSLLPADFFERKGLGVLKEGGGGGDVWADTLCSCFYFVLSPTPLSVWRGVV